MPCFPAEGPHFGFLVGIFFFGLLHMLSLEHLARVSWGWAISSEIARELGVS